MAHKQSLSFSDWSPDTKYNIDKIEVVPSWLASLKIQEILCNFVTYRLLTTIQPMYEGVSKSFEPQAFSPFR